MLRDNSSNRPIRRRTIQQRDPLSQATFNIRRSLSRVSLVDAGAVLLVWGNIVGLIAYPFLADHEFSKKTAHKAAAVKQIDEQS